MSFLFGKKNKEKGGAPPTRDGAASQSSIPTANGVRPRGPSGVSSPAPGAPANNLDGTLTPTQEPAYEQKGPPEHESPHGPARTMPPSNPNSSALYPWSQKRLNFTTSQSNPFPRYGAAVNAVSSKEGEIYLMGGLINGSTVKGDLWMIESAGGQNCYPIGTTFEGPGPRVGHASILVGNAFIVFGGDTKMDERDKLDDTLYLLNTHTRHWSRALPPGFRPAGRYGHTLNILGSKIYVFGGQVEGYFFNDLTAFDLNALQNSNSKWELLIPNSLEGGPPEGAIPPARTNHTLVTHNDKLFLFGGTNGTKWFSDVWSYDSKYGQWTELECIGYIPVAREGHSAALVGDVMYIFGGRTEEGTDLGDLAAFKISTRRWYTFQNMGPSPSARSGHSMTAYGKQIVVLAGEPSSAPRDPAELSLIYILDTGKIRYPNDAQIQQTPAGERVPGNRRPSQERSGSSQRGLISQNIAPEGPNRTGMAPNLANRGQESNLINGPSPPGSRLPRASVSQQPSGPPPQQQAPPPRSNGVAPSIAPAIAPAVAPGSGPRSRTPTRDVRGYGAQGEQTRGPAESNEAMVASLGGPAPRPDPATRAMSPVVNGRRTPQGGQRFQSPEEEYDAQMGRSRSRQGTQGSAPMEDPRQGQQQRGINPYGQAPQEVYRTDPAQLQQIQQLQEQHQGLQNQHEGLQKELTSIRGEREGLQTQHESLQGQQQKLLQELESSKSRNAWYASEMALAKKAGYQPQTSQSNSLDEKAAFDDEEQPLIEALISMRAQLAEVQGTVVQRENLAAQQLAEIEHQRDNAIREATFAKAKLAAHGGSHAGTPQSESATRDFGDDDRAGDIGKKLAAALATHKELRTTIASLTSDLSNEKRGRELAEGTADAAQRRAAEFEGSRNPGELETLRADLHRVGKSSREEAAAKAEAHSKMELLQVERQDLARQLSEAVESTQQHGVALGSLREAVTSSNEKASHLERKLEEERQQREAVDRKLLQLRGEHEERTAELEETSRRLRDAEELASTHAAEANTHRQAVITGLDKLNARGGGHDRGVVEDERVPLLKQQVESAHQLVRQHQTDADGAADKLRKAEERIAGLETFQEQSSRESLSLRKQLQDALRESQAVAAQHAAARQQIEVHHRDVSALNIKHNALKELLDERERARSLESPSPDTPDPARVRELESQLESSQRAHQETKDSFETSQIEVEKSYNEKLALLESDYQSAVGYVKGTEKMLKRMKDELTKYKKQNERLQMDLDGRGPEAAAEWEHERQNLRQEIEEMQRSVKDTHSQLETQIVQIQDELHEMTDERDRYRKAAESAKQSINLAQRARTELESLRNENEQLEKRAVDAEQKVTLLLDQVGNSVGAYRRQSQNLHSNPGTNGHSSHTRNLSAISSSSSANPAPLNLGGGPSFPSHAHTKSTDTDRSFGVAPEPHHHEETGTSTNNNNRNSMALDSLASELESLRSQWADTHRTYRLSNSQNQFEADHSAPNSATGAGNMSESLANWRKRLDAEEAAKQGKTGGAGASSDRAEHSGKEAGGAVIRPSDKMPGGLGGLSDSEISEDDDVKEKAFVPRRR